MNGASYYKCTKCGYEFLSKSDKPTCPRCYSPNLETKDIKSLTELRD